MPSERERLIARLRELDAAEETTASVNSPSIYAHTENEAVAQELLYVANERLQEEADANKYYARTLERENRELKKELDKLKQQNPEDSFTVFLRKNHEFHDTVPLPYHLEEKKKLAEAHKKLEAEIKALKGELNVAQEETKLSEAVQKEFYILNQQSVLLVSQTKEEKAALERKLMDSEFQNRKLQRTIEQLEAKVKKLREEEPRFITSSSQGSSARSTPRSSLFPTPQSSGRVSPQSSDIAAPSKTVLIKK